MFIFVPIPLETIIVNLQYADMLACMEFFWSDANKLQMGIFKLILAVFLDIYVKLDDIFLINTNKS